MITFTRPVQVKTFESMISPATRRSKRSISAAAYRPDAAKMLRFAG